MFGNMGTTSTPATGAGGLFGGLGSTTQATTTQPQSGNLFAGLGAPSTTPATGTAQTQQSGGLFGGLAGGAQTKPATGGSLFGQAATSTSQPQNKPMFGGLGSASTTGGLLYVPRRSWRCRIFHVY